MKKQSKKTIRYAVVGLGHIAQVAVLPAFRNLRNSKLTALVSGDKTKLMLLAKRYGVEHTYPYEEYDVCLQSGEIDAVYIALPNHMHHEYALKAAEAGIHVLCEKPLAVTSKDAQEMIRVANRKNVQLMTAYRLHFDPANLKAIDTAHSGKIGDLQYFTSEFSHQIKGDNIRAQEIEGGSPLHDLGIYCINASRYIMKAEPTEVFAFAANPSARLPEIDQTVFATLRFPNDRMASFMCSFASTAVSNFRVLGSKGDLFVKNAYEYVGERTHELTVDEKTKSWTSKAGDQFAAELDYFSECVLKDRKVETSGLEGLADLKVIEALMQSMKTGKAVRMKGVSISKRPTLRQEIRKAPHRKPQLVHAEPES